MLDLGLCPGDRLMCLRQFLYVVDAGAQRIVVALRRLDLQHVQDHLRVLGVVLVPAIMQCFSRPRERQRRHQPHLETRFSQAPCDGPMIIARRLEGTDHRATVRPQDFDQMIVLSTVVEDLQTASAFMAWVFD